MYQQAIELVEQSIFPIFFEQEVNNEKKIGVRGTGFFIGGEGHFLTANHVISGAPTGSKILYLGCLPSKPIPSGSPLEIETVFEDEEHDIYVGKISSESLPPLTVDLQHHKKGKSVCLCGYPLAELSMESSGKVNIRQVRQYWQPTYIIDKAEGKNGTSYKGFITQHASLKGMSGGPVFDILGQVCGMDIKHMRRNIKLNENNTMLVDNGIAISIQYIQEVVPGDVPIFL